MKDKIQNLIKNVIEENAVRAKEQANKALYEKVGNRLKNEYINVSRKIFYNLNEVAGDRTPGGLNTPEFNHPPVTLPTPGKSNTPLGDYFKPYKDGDTWTEGGIKYKMENGIIYFWYVFKDGNEGWLPLNW